MAILGIELDNLGISRRNLGADSSRYATDPRGPMTKIQHANTPSRWRWLTTIALGLTSALAALTPHPRALAAETTVTHGPFTLVATPRRVSSGGFPNTRGSPFATTEVTEFTVRWRDKPVKSPSGTTRFWRVLRLDDAPEPALLLVTTGFVLLSEREGQLRWQTLLAESTSLAELQWLDSEAGQPGASVQFGIEKVALETGTRLGGGRYLRLGSSTVLDVKTFKTFPIEPWVPMVPGKPVHPLSRDGYTARAFAPDQSAFVLAASGYDHENQGRPMVGLLVVDLPRGTARALRLDRRRTRFADNNDLTPAWVAHHFEWRASSEGMQLVPRAGAAPWPWRGRLWETSSGQWQVDVLRIDPRFGEVVRTMLRTRFSAVPVVADPKAPFSGGELRVGRCELSVRGGEADARPEDQRVSVWNAAPSPSQRAEGGEGCGALMRDVARAIDAELGSGRHDGLLRLGDGG
jgi:hypothetical protein